MRSSHSTNPVIKHKAGLLNLAEELSNVSKACKIMGASRDTFYRYRELADEGGVDALINRSRRAPNLKNRTGEATEQVVVDYAVAFPAHGQHRTSNELRKQGAFISGSVSGYAITFNAKIIGRFGDADDFLNSSDDETCEPPRESWRLN
ncbi:TPA: helix-turn-helix domain-containing protein, partial [Escherichia coli]